MMHFVYVVTYLGKMVVIEREIRSLMITWLGQNGQIPSIFEIFCPETLFRKNIVIYHFLWYSSLVSSSTIFFKSNVT